MSFGPSRVLTMWPGKVVLAWADDVTLATGFQGSHGSARTLSDPDNPGNA